MKINVAYIDDVPDGLLSAYLGRHLEEDLRSFEKDVDLTYEEIIFTPSMGYEGLLSNAKLQTAHVAIIDSKLFDLSNADGGMLTGEMLRIILRKCLPYLETIVITSQEDNAFLKMSTLRKYNRAVDRNVKAEEYYRNLLSAPLRTAVTSIKMTRLIGGSLNGSIIDEVLYEKVRNSIDGVEIFSELTGEQIDKAIEGFESVKELIDRARKGL